MPVSTDRHRFTLTFPFSAFEVSLSIGGLRSREPEGISDRPAADGSEIVPLHEHLRGDRCGGPGGEVKLFQAGSILFLENALRRPVRARPLAFPARTRTLRKTNQANNPHTYHPHVLPAVQCAHDSCTWCGAEGNPEGRGCVSLCKWLFQRCDGQGSRAVVDVVTHAGVKEKTWSTHLRRKQRRSYSVLFLGFS